MTLTEVRSIRVTATIALGSSPSVLISRFCRFLVLISPRVTHSSLVLA